VGVKFPMTDKIEEHIKFCLRAGVDFLVLDGAQGGHLRRSPRFWQTTLVYPPLWAYVEPPTTWQTTIEPAG